MSRQFNRRGPVQSQQRKPFCKVCHDAGKCEEEYTSHNVRDRDGNTICITLLNQECRFCFQTGHTVKFCPVLKEREETKEKYAKGCARLERVKLHEEKKKPAPALCKASNGGGFAALADDSDSDEGSPRKEQKVTDAYAKGQAYFDRVEVGLTMEFPGFSRFCRANGTSIAAIALSSEMDDHPNPKTHEEEFPALSSNVTLRSHQQHFATAEGESFAATLQKPKPQVQPKKVAVVVPVAQHDAWSDDEESKPAVAAAAPVPFKSFTFKKITNWADCESSDDEDDEPYFSDGDSYRNR